MASPIVSLSRADTYEPMLLRQALETLLEPLGGMGRFVKPGNRVLLKPNLLTATATARECVTRPELVVCVASMVKAAGGKPFMGDSPAFGSARGVAKANGYLPMLESLEIPIVEFTGRRYERPGHTLDHLRLSKEAMEADRVINLPKVKSHVQLTLTLGVKNLFGCVPGKMKAWWHLEAGKDVVRFAAMLVETADAIRPDLTVADGIVGHGGNGPSGGYPYPLGVLGASDDCFALDLALARVLAVDPDSIPTIATSRMLGMLSDEDAIAYPLYRPQDLAVAQWPLPSRMTPIDFGVPRIFRSSLKQLYIRLIKEPIALYARK